MSDYHCVTTVAGIKKYLGDSTLVAFDFETAPDGLYRGEDKAALDPARAHIVGCSFSMAEGTGIYVPVNHLSGINIDIKAFYHFLGEFLTNPDITKVAHNIAFESAFAYHQGIVIQPPVYDTICASQLTLMDDFKFRTLSDSGLKQLAEELCGETLPSFTDVTKGGHFDELNAQDPETVRYGSADSDFSLRLYHIFNSWFDTYLPKHRYIVEGIESPTAVYLGIMKHNGIPLDLPFMEKCKIQAEKEIEELRQKIGFIIGDVPIGVNCSTVAFKKYLFQELRLPIREITGSNEESVDDITMTLLKEWCDDNRPELSSLFTLVREYRRRGKIKSTYIDGYLQYINSVTGRIHPDIYALSTDTGRMNCQRPNAQNMPRKDNDPIGVRNFIIAPDDQIIISCDFSQIELRVGAFYCRDEKMLEIYHNNGDIHAATTSVIFGVSYDEAQDKHRPGYKEQRVIAKNVNFGTFYGLFAGGLQKTLKFKANIDKSKDECQAILDSLKIGYKNLTAWQEATKVEATQRMYSETWLGRRRYLPNIRNKDWGLKSFSQRCALNTPIQGTAADILKLAIVRILKGLPEHPWIKPMLQIHDELVFIVPEEKLNEAVIFIKECMEKQPFPEFDVPLIAEAAAGKTFGTLEELED